MRRIVAGSGLPGGMPFILALALVAGCAGPDDAATGDVAAGGNEERLVDACTVTGRVVDGAGTGIEGAEVSVLRVGGPALTTVTPADGSFRLAPVPVGPQTLQAVKLGYREDRETITCAAGEVLEGLALELVPEEPEPVVAFEVQERTERGTVLAPWVHEDLEDGKSTCGYLVPPQDVSFVDFPVPVDGDAVGVTLLLAWNPSVATPQTVPDLNLCLNDPRGVQRATDVNKTHPARIAFNFTGTGDAGDWTARVFLATGVNVAFTLQIETTVKVFRAP